MKKISKIIMCIILTIVITFLLSMPITADTWTISSNWDGDKYHVVTNGDVCLGQTTQDSPSRSTNLLYGTGKWGWEKTTDGDWSTYAAVSRNSRGHSEVFELPFPMGAYVDLSPYSVNKFKYKLLVDWGTLVDTPTFERSNSFAGPWTVICNVTADGNVRTATFPSCNYAYYRVRMKIKSAFENVDYWKSSFKVYEVQLYEAGYWASGHWTSPSKNSTYNDAVWGRLFWSVTLNGQMLKFQVATNNDNATWSFRGADGSTSSYYTDSGQKIWSGHDGDRYIKLRAYFWGTTDKTPVLHDVSVCWNPYPDPPTLTAPENNAWINDNTPLFDWNFNDPHPGAAQEGFHLIIDDSPDFSGAYFDSGLQESTSSQWQFPDGTGYTTIPDGTWYWKCCTKNNYDFWGATSTHSMFHLDTTPPPTPVMDPEPELTPGFQNMVSWVPVGDGSGIGGVKYYVECSSDSSFISVVDNSGWIDGDSYEFGKIVPLKDGVTYYYRVKAKDALGNQSEYSAPEGSKQVKPLITEWYARPNPFSPNADGTEDTTTIYYTLSSSCTTTIEVYDTKDNLKKRLVDGKSRPVGANSEIWDGTDENGRIVSNGAYTYKITAEDQWGNKGEKQGTVTVHNLVSIFSTIPEDNGYFVIGEDKDIKITFNRHMSSTTMTLENIIIRDEDGLRMYEADVVYVSSVTIITPSKLEYCTRYTVEVSKGVTDYLEIPLTKATSFSFTTLIPGSETGKVRVEHKGGIVEIDNPSETFPGGSKGWYINLVKTDIRSLDKYVEGTGRILICYGVDYSDNPRDIDELDRPVTISMPYPSETKDRKNLKLYFYNKEIDRWELVKGSGYRNPDDGDYYVTGEVSITNTEYCVRGFAMGGLIEEYSNYPNPFKAGKQETTIRYNLEEAAKVTISIYDLLGQLVRRIEIPKATPGRGEQGTNTVPWNGKNERGIVVANGGYYCVMEADTETGKHIRKARKIMVIK